VFKHNLKYPSLSQFTYMVSCVLQFKYNSCEDVNLLNYPIIIKVKTLMISQMSAFTVARLIPGNVLPPVWIQQEVVIHYVS